MTTKWTEAEDEMLRTLFATHGKQWSVIASQIPNRNPAQVASRWDKCINPALMKGPFSPEEDALLIEYVQTRGTQAWPGVTSVLPHRSAKQCRERWLNSLSDSVNKSPWTADEDMLIFQLYQTYGPRWSKIAQFIAGRTDNSIKNRWNASLKHRSQVGPSGKQILAPSTARKYTKRRPPQTPHCPPLAIPPIVTGGTVDVSFPAILGTTSIPIGPSPSLYDSEVDNPNFGFDALELEDPYGTAQIGFGFDFD
jgi:hypothetical protein